MAAKVLSWSSMRTISSSTLSSSNSPENQPDTSCSPWPSRIGLRTAGSIGNLTPVSVPEKPAARVSARHTSSGVSPPSSGRSLLVQAIGAMARRMAMPQTPTRCFVLPSSWSARAARTSARSLTSGTATSHHASPPVHCSGWVLMTMTVVRSLARARWKACFEVADALDGLGDRAQPLGMLGEVGGDVLGDLAVLEEVVEGGRALGVLEPADDRVAAVVADHDDQLVPGEDRGVELGVHHQVRTVADEDDDLALGVAIFEPSPPAIS